MRARQALRARLDRRLGRRRDGSDARVSRNASGTFLLDERSDGAGSSWPDTALVLRLLFIKDDLLPDMYLRLCKGVLRL